MSARRTCWTFDDFSFSAVLIPLLHPFERADYNNPPRSQVELTIY